LPGRFLGRRTRLREAGYREVMEDHVDIDVRSVIEMQGQQPGHR
jgi:hypothetical protein